MGSQEWSSCILGQNIIARHPNVARWEAFSEFFILVGYVLMYNSGGRISCTVYIFRRLLRLTLFCWECINTLLFLSPRAVSKWCSVICQFRIRSHWVDGFLTIHHRLIRYLRRWIHHNQAVLLIRQLFAPRVSSFINLSYKASASVRLSQNFMLCCMYIS